jgi:hypothetical protein
MPTPLMFLVIHEIILLLNHMLNRRKDLIRKPTHAQRFRNLSKHGAGRGQLAVGIDGPREAGGEPIEGDVGEDGVEGGGGVGPFEEFFADPYSSSVKLLFFSVFGVCGESGKVRKGGGTMLVVQVDSTTIHAQSY